MAGWRLRQSYGFGAAKLPVAPVFAPGPWTTRETSAEALALLADELAALDAGPLVRGAAGALLVAIGVAVTVLWLAPQEQARDVAMPEIVLIEPAPEELLPEPEPEPIAEPELPLAEAQPEVPPEPVVEPVHAPPPPVLRAEPVRAPAPAPKLRIDAVAKAPVPAAVTPPRVVRPEAPTRVTPSFRIDPVAASFAVAATAPAAEEPAPLRAVSRPPVRAAPPVSFSLDPLASDAEPEAPAPSPVLRAEPRPAPVRLASAKPAALPRFDAAPPPARYAEALSSAALPAPKRVTRTAAKQGAPAPAPSQAFQGVPLGSLAACVSDREEDALKLDVMAAAGVRRECASRAGRYRFVETKNLNAFLMWIERNPSRKPVDRCVELRLALECLAGTPNRRTDNG